MWHLRQHVQQWHQDPPDPGVRPHILPGVRTDQPRRAALLPVLPPADQQARGRPAQVRVRTGSYHTMCQSGWQPWQQQRPQQGTQRTHESRGRADSALRTDVLHVLHDAGTTRWRTPWRQPTCHWWSSWTGGRQQQQQQGSFDTHRFSWTRPARTHVDRLLVTQHTHTRTAAACRNAQVGPGKR
jgi:hypothetical protein